MTRNQLVRILCVALVTVTLALALILAVAVIGGVVATPSVPDADTDFRPSFPEGSFDFGDIWESMNPEDFTRDPHATPDPDVTRPSEPEMTLPDWEGGWEWPTLPPSLETSPDFELPTLPEGWDTLPEEWDTLPPEWGDSGEGLPFDPDDLADLLAGMDGGLGMPPGALAAGVVSQLTVMEIYAERNDRLYLKMRSFGDFTGQEWGAAESYTRLMGGGTYSAAYLPHFAMNQMDQVKGYPLVITPVMDARVIPYYITSTGASSEMQEGDVQATGSTDGPYTLYYRPYAAHNIAGAGETPRTYERDYRRAMAERYLAVDGTTMEYLRLIITQQGFDKDDPDIVEKVATYIQNAAVYNLAYDQNLDREPNVALAFLGAYKEGVCRHFATAATLLYRALGIPARYTVGFMTDVTAGETATVKGMDAHAWVEVYEDGFGWRYVEVTGYSAGDDPTYPPETDTGTDTAPGTGYDPTYPPEPGTGTDTAPGTEDDTDTPDPEPTKQELTLKPVDMAVPYTGENFVHNGRLEGFEALAAKGYTYEAEVQGKRAVCGVSVTTISWVKIYDPKGNDVTHLFRVTKKSGTLHVYEAELTFGSSGQSKTYDGAPLKTAAAVLLSGELPEGYTVEILSTGTQTHVGVGYAAFDVVIWYDQGGGDLVDRTHYFLISKVYGTLTVTPAPLTLKAADAEKTYDGEALTANAIDLMGGNTADGDYIDSFTVEGSQTRVGRSENLITDVVIRNADGEDVTRNYAIETVAGYLKVSAP